MAGRTAPLPIATSRRTTGDNISFTDERLTRTPMFEPRLDKYYRDLVPPEADSIEREADMMLLQSRVSKPLFQYLLVYLVQRYVNPEYMGQDAVFVHLFEKYINTGQAEFFTEKYRTYLNNRAYSLMANLIGQPAANLEMVDTAGTPRPLYNVNAPFIVVCFWDPTCGHCMEIVPKLDSIFKAKWKAEGVQLYGVMVDGGKEAWVSIHPGSQFSRAGCTFMRPGNTRMPRRRPEHLVTGSCMMYTKLPSSIYWTRTNALSPKTFLSAA